MKKQAVRAFVLLCGGVLFVGGCATQEAVKKDETLVPSTVSQTKQVNEKPAASETGSTPVAADGVQPESQPAKANTDASATNVLQLHTALENIYFDFDAPTLSEQARTTLVKNVDMMRKNPAVTVRIEGNCDERGSSEYNLALGEKRAKSAKQYMATLGVPEKRLSVISYGKEKPADTGHDEAAWAKNRRDEFVIISK
jgi:peptidoglycan-associated lipoprotein